jgi:hypothetical protein
MPRRSSRIQEVNTEEELAENLQPENETPTDPPSRPIVASSIRQRHRAVAEREASRLARPEHRDIGAIGHASKSKSAVTSTPFGISTGMQSTLHDDKQEWCGPFSVARQVSFPKSCI